MTPVADRRSPEPVGCPLLGLPDDPRSRFSFASADHRCWADRRPRPVDLAHQGAFCLAETYPECARYRAAAAARRPGAATPEAPAIALERARTETSAPGAPGAPGEPGRRPPRRPSRRRRAATVVLAGVVLAGAAYLSSPAIAAWIRQVGVGTGAGSPSPSAAPPATPAPTPAPTPTPRPTPTWVPTATPVATATPIRTPTPAASPLVHVVVRGETLGGIADRYGVTLAAIQEANGIANPSLIRVGERLVIPRP